MLCFVCSLLLLAGCTPVGPSGDTTPPTVALGVLPDRVSAAQTLELTADASDDVGVEQVVFYQGSDQAGGSPSRIAQDSAAPYRAELPLSAQDNGVLVFYATALDAAGNLGTSDEVSVTVDIAVNSEPIFTSTPITGAISGVEYRYVITAEDAEDSAAGGAPTIHSPVLPAWLDLVDRGDGSAVLSGTPTDADLGAHPVELRATDGAGAEASQAFLVTVSNTNAPPRFDSTPVLSVDQGERYEYDVAASDPDGDPLTLAVEQAPGWLTLSDDGDGSGLLAGTPGAGDVGSHEVRLRVTDSAGVSTPQTFTLTVVNVNDPPSIGRRPASRNVIRNTVAANRVTVSFTVSDPDGETPTVTATSSNGQVVANASLDPDCGGGSCTLTFTPSPAKTASTTITITATDGAGAKDSASFQVNLLPRLVRNNADSGPGSLRGAVADADAGDVIGFTASVATIALDAQLTLDKALTLEGPGRDALTLQGGPNGRVLRVTDDAVVVVRDLSVTGGVAPDNASGNSTGGGIIVLGDSSLTLTRVRVSDNRAEFGAGVYNQGTLLVRDSIIEDHVDPLVGGTSWSGTAVYNDGGEATIEDSTLRNNFGGPDFLGDGIGGTVFNDRGTLVVTDSSVVDNEAAIGGGIYNTAVGQATLTGSTVARNEANNIDLEEAPGGGIYNRGSVTLVDTEVSNNTAVGRGGGVFTAGTLTLDAATSITANTAGTTAEFEVAFGGGVFVDASGTFNRNGATISGNSPDDVFEVP